MLDFGGHLGEGWNSWALRGNPGLGEVAVYQPVIDIQFGPISILAENLQTWGSLGVPGVGQVEVGSTAPCRAGMREGQILIRGVHSRHSQAVAPEGWGLLVKAELSQGNLGSLGLLNL